VSVAPFGVLNGEPVHEITLARGGLEARILTYGAVVRDLLVPVGSDRQRVVLGFEAIEPYRDHSPYFGAIVGRYANRIGRARFTLDGTEHRLVPNEGANQLHGGPRGFGTRIWSLLAATAESCTLALVSEDGDMGYPGRLTATCTYVLTEPATLRIVLQATADAPTPVNLTTHGYYNLDGSSDICAHHLTIAGSFVTPTDRDKIPTGEVRPVEGTDYDFRSLRPIGATQLLRCRTTFDINYVLDGPQGAGLRHAATLASRNNGLAMELWTTEPGLQFYDGHMLDIPVPGLRGASYRARAGLCLEPQRFPDGPNRRHFPSCLLRPGEVSRQESELRFSVG
jgi:aldose 1-epimerase